MSYNNPTSKRIYNGTGHCCDNPGSNNCNDECDNDFTFCLRRSGDSECTYGRYDTGLVAMDDDTLTFGNNTIGENTVPNPLIFNGTEWPCVNVRLCSIVLYSLCVI